MNTDNFFFLMLHYCFKIKFKLYSKIIILICTYFICTKNILIITHFFNVTKNNHHIIIILTS